MLQEDIAFGYSRESFDKRNYSSLAALVILLLDLITSCRTEYIYIWRVRFTPMKLLYLWSRYYALITQIVHYSFIHILLGQGPVSPSHCKIWFWFLAGSCATLQFALDVILILRIYALYMKNLKVLILAVPLFLEFAVAFILIGRNVHDDAFNDKCDLRRTPIEAVPLAVIVCLGHLAIWMATFSKRKIAQGNAAVVDTVVNSGHLSFIMLGLTAFTTTIVCFTSRTVNPVIIFVWPVSFISITSCRIVLNVRSLKFERPSVLSGSEFPSSTIILTTFDTHELTLPVRDNS